MTTPMQDAEKDADLALDLVQECSRHFAGKPSDVQGAALADLLALWLAGHVIVGNPRATERLRRKMLDMHLKTMWDLVPINYAHRVEPQLRQGGRGAKLDS
jgi:hypothetical protein